jgi:prevent-host-death family protein
MLHEPSSSWLRHRRVGEDAAPTRLGGTLAAARAALSVLRPGDQLVANFGLLCYKYNMTSVGVRELRQRASELLRLVEQGEVIEITDRGRPVARLTPLPTGTPLEQMRASGEIEPASGDIADLPEPLVLPDGVETPSAALARLRSQER